MGYEEQGQPLKFDALYFILGTAFNGVQSREVQLR